MTDQTDRLIDEIHSKNKSENYDRENTIKLHTLQDIWRDTDKLDNISEHLMRKFNNILRGGAWCLINLDYGILVINLRYG